MASSGLPEEQLTIAEFARRVGAHPNTIRKLIRDKKLEAVTQDTITGQPVPPGAPKPTRFRYLIPASSTQHAASLLHDNVRPGVKVGRGPEEPTSTPETPVNPLASQVTLTLAERVRLLEMENDFLKRTVTGLERDKDRLFEFINQRLLPAAVVAPNTGQAPYQPEVTSPEPPPQGAPVQDAAVRVPRAATHYEEAPVAAVQAPPIGTPAEDAEFSIPAAPAPVEPKPAKTPWWRRLVGGGRP